MMNKAALEKGNRVYYDCIFEGSRRHLKTTDKADLALAHALAQKSYDENILKKAEKENAARFGLH